MGADNYRLFVRKRDGSLREYDHEAYGADLMRTEVNDEGGVEKKPLSAAFEAYFRGPPLGIDTVYVLDVPTMMRMKRRDALKKET
jgi:hypothetical protein